MHRTLAAPNAEKTEYLDVEGAARFLGVSIDWLNKRRMRGRQDESPPFLRVGRKVRYRKDDLESWLATQVVNPLN